MKHVFIINPVAGKIDQSSFLIKQIEEVFSNLNYQIEITQKEKDATLIARRYAQSGEMICFYACGGDGTLNEIVNGMYDAPNTRLAIVPIGTGNDFIKYFKNLEIKDFLDLKALLYGEEMMSDVLRCNGRVCLNIASVGFDARVVEQVAKFKRLPLVSGRTAYLFSVFYSFLASIKFRHSLEIDGKRIENKNYIFVVAANGTFYGGGFHPTPHATINDGYMDILTIDSLSRFRVIGLMKTYKRGEHLTYDFVTQYRCKKIKIMGENNITLNMDGETSIEKNPEIELLPKAIRLILPKK